MVKHNQKVKLIYFEHHYDDMIIKNYKFGDIHRLLKSFSFEMIKKAKCYLENLLSMSTKIKILKKIKLFCFIFLISTYSKMLELLITFLKRYL